MKNSVTNEQYNLFIKDKGYSKQEFWTEEGWQWCEKNKLIERLNWQDTKRDRSRFPTVEFTWYEATAFAKWLALTTGEGLLTNLKPSGKSGTWLRWSRVSVVRLLRSLR